MTNFTLHAGDNREVMRTFEDNSFDAVITDPPYGIDFLGKAWDANTGALKTYQECLRVLKPGGYLLAFSAARTYHHLAYTLEVAGFEIRDQLMWLYSSGFPKAQDIGKAIDKRGIDNEWAGWKTALKPAHEPICMARKPFKGSTIDNVLKHGVGALNIDATRIEVEGEDTRSGGANGVSRLTFGEGETSNEDSKIGYTPNEQGRFPSNVIGEVAGYQKYFYCPKVSRRERHIGCVDPGEMFKQPRKADGKPVGEGESMAWDPSVNGQKAIKTQPAGTNNHPTVKPVALMRYLIQLVTPANSRVLDPFNGSGSTGMAATELGHEYVGIDLDPNYIEIARRRIEAWNEPEPEPEPTNNFNDLFDEGC